MQKVDVSELQGPLTEFFAQVGGQNGRKRFDEFKLWLKGVAASVITVIRGRFNPTEFIGEGCSIITEETDTRSTKLTELDLTKVQHVTMLKNGENVVKGEEKQKRLKKDGRIRLDADIFYTLWTNQHLIPESWKEPINGNTRYIFFDGTVLRRSDGRRCVLCLCWLDGRWDWNAYWLALDWNASSPSAVLAS